MPRPFSVVPYSRLHQGSMVTQRHAATTHWYFKVYSPDSPMSVDELAELLGLQCEPVMAPFPNALYAYGGSGHTPAVVVRYNRVYGEIVFAVAIAERHYIERALSFAEPTPPVR